MKKLIYKDGNLLTANDVEVIGHQANCQNTFGAGIAKSIKEMYPKAFYADTMACKDGTAVLGNYSFCRVENGPIKKIFNLYGQNLYGKGKRQTNYESLYNALEGMRTCIESEINLPSPSVGFPYLMGCGLGGGDWRIVERLIEVAFHDYDGDVIIYKFKQ
jgi:O-acetyl-ADP-ribose deacetylase (regulator of RNase III)